MQIGNALLTYTGLAALAAVEASPLGCFIPGTLVVVAAGGMVQSGTLDGPATLLAIWTGVFLGDVLTYGLARKFGDTLRKWKPLAGALSRAEGRLNRHPVLFVLASHLSPFLKNFPAPAAGLARMPWSRFLPLEAAAALLDAVWFTAVGFFLSASLGNLTDAPVILRVVGTVACFAVVIFFVGRGRACVVPQASLSKGKAKRGHGFLGKCFVLVGPWEASWRLGKRVGIYDRPEFRKALNRALAVARHGDIIAIGRVRPAPWGNFSHLAMVVETAWGKFLIHAFEANVQLCPEVQFPMPGKIAVVRVAGADPVRFSAVAAAMGQLAKPFRLWNRKPGTTEPATFSCVSLVSWAYLQAGVDLTETIPVGQFAVPDDVVSSPCCEVVFEFGSGRVNPPPSLAPVPESASVAVSWRMDPGFAPSIQCEGTPHQLAACLSCAAPCPKGRDCFALTPQRHLSPSSVNP